MTQSAQTHTHTHKFKQVMETGSEADTRQAIQFVFSLLSSYTELYRISHLDSQRELVLLFVAAVLQLETCIYLFIKFAQTILLVQLSKMKFDLKHGKLSTNSNSIKRHTIQNYSPRH